MLQVDVDLVEEGEEYFITIFKNEDTAHLGNLTTCPIKCTVLEVASTEGGIEFIHFDSIDSKYSRLSQISFLLRSYGKNWILEEVDNV